MCGIVGVYGLSDQSLIKKMSNKIIHRGPDDEGYYVDDSISLGMRRLSIIDLQTGKQPIFNEDGSIVVVYNGEIYNFRELKKELESKGHRFYTNTDTEVIVHAYEEYGYGFVSRFNGMFAFALWNSDKKELILARDRLGIKPLYYTFSDGKFFFASEIKSILEYEEIERDVDKVALANYFTLRYVPAPRTMFKSIFKVEPGHLIVLRDGEFRKEKYWDLHYSPINADETYIAEKVLKMLKESVKRRLIADVPLGAFLSGGIDSSTIVALMSQLMDEPVKTFSVGFEGAEYDETPYARIIAEKFETDHHEIFVDIDQIDLLPKIVYHFDEPLADPAAIPTLLISELARKKVKVVLTGEGGDEAFGGYEKYLHELKMFSRLSKLPKIARVLNSSIANLLNKRRLALYFSFVAAKGSQVESYTFRLRNMDWGSMWIVKTCFDDQRDYISNMLYYDIKYWLPDDLLMKVDKMSMAKSLEARVPYLDHEFLSFAYNIPTWIKLGNDGKYALKKAVSGLLPKEIIYREKHGFDVPISKWLREDHELLQMYLHRDVLREIRFIDVSEVERLWNLHRKGKSFESVLWKVLCYSIWYNKYILERA
jgi:asparagine synthase (glutamine-hydrolysing)